MKNLIEKYFNGETTCEEEALIRDYFQQGNIAKDLQQFTLYFHGFSLLKKQLKTPLSDSHHTNFIAISSKTMKTAKQIRRREQKWFRISAAVVGTAAIIFITFILLRPTKTQCYVLIDGKKHTDKTLVMNTFYQSIENIRIDKNEFDEIFQDVKINEE
jgi:hypothetical protein